jgi:hypothetical protein
MPQQTDKITIMDVESPNSKEDQNLLLAPWGNNHQIVFSNGDMSPKIPRSPSSVFSFAPKSPGGGSHGMRYCVKGKLIFEGFVKWKELTVGLWRFE